MTICVEDLERMDFSDVARGDKRPPVPTGKFQMRWPASSVLSLLPAQRYNATLLDQHSRHPRKFPLRRKNNEYRKSITSTQRIQM